MSTDEALLDRRVSHIGAGTVAPGSVPGVRREHQKFYIGIFITALAAGFIISPAAGILFFLFATPAFFALTMETAGGTLGGKLERAFYWRYRVRRGIDGYEPFDHEAWERHVKGEELLSKKAIARMRVWPDATDGMTWLYAEPRMPAIAKHEPIGQEPYYAIAYSVEGRLRGLESDIAMDDGARAWGEFLASMGGTLSLAKQVQTITRVLPPDMAWHEHWVRSNMAADAPDILKRSYTELLSKCEAGALVQRHYVVVKYPIDDNLNLQAQPFGDGEDGHRRLMHEERDAMTRALEGAHVGKVAALTARQTVAVILHMQDPARPIEQVDDVDENRHGLRSQDTRRSTKTIGADGREWRHATAVITGSKLSNEPRLSLWLFDLLMGMRQPIIRTISFHCRVVPAAEARRRADRDVNAAEMEIVTSESKLKLVDKAVIQARDEAERKRTRLAPGQRTHGVVWIAYMTVSAESARELNIAKRLVTEQALNGLGLEKLTWTDSRHSSAMGTTMPTARGLRDVGSSLGGRAAAALGRASTEGTDDE